MDTVLLKSEHDKQTYADYLDGKRRYFTVNGMELDTLSNNYTSIVEFLKHKYQISSELATEYIESYNMETGIIFSNDPTVTVTASAKYMGCIAYIKDNFLFMSYVVNPFRYEKLEDRKKYVEESFKPQGQWNYQDCTVESLGAVCYESTLAIKKLQVENDILNKTTKNIETMTSKICFNLVENSEKHARSIEKCRRVMKNYPHQSFSEQRVRNSINKCFRKVYLCSNKLEYHIQKCQEKEDEIKIEYELSITRRISLASCIMIAFILYIA